MKMLHMFRRAAYLLLATGLAVFSIQVQALEPARGKVILTVSGKIAEKNQGETAQFDLAMLERLPQRSFTTMTPWARKPVKFSGPLLRDVLAAVGSSGSLLRAVALNDYQTSIPADDARKFDVILAHRMDDREIPVKTKGPLFIVYPYDTSAELQSNTYYERSAWQLKSLSVE